MTRKEIIDRINRLLEQTNRRRLELIYRIIQSVLE